MDISALDNQLRLDFVPRPGIVYFLTTDDCSDREWERYLNRLTIMMERHGLQVTTRRAPRADLSHYTVARLFNLGNIGGKSYAWISGGRGVYTAIASIEAMAEKLVWLENWDKGSIDVTDDGYGPDMYMNTMPAGAIPPDAGIHAVCADERGSDNFDSGISNSRPRLIPEPTAPQAITEYQGEELRREIPPTPEESAFLEHLDSERRDIINRIGMLVADYVRQYHEMPPMELFEKCASGKFIVIADKYSPVVVNGNMEIVLPHYNELTLRLTPLPRIIYILFLMHPEGIRLKEIADYRKKLEELYLLVKPGSDERLARQSIEYLCTPGSESLNQKISMIKRAVKLQLNMPEIVEHYTISGKRGEVYRLPAAEDAVLPKAVIGFR